MLFVFGLVHLCLVPAAMAVGCPNCLGFDKSVITSTCSKACADPTIGFPDQDSITNCQQYCSTFANKDGCCNTITCSSDPLTCTHPQSLTSRDTTSDDEALKELERIKRDPSLINFSRLISRDWPYHLIGSTEEIRSLDPHSLADWQMEGSQTHEIRRRTSATICCKVAKGMAMGAMAMLPVAYQSEDDFQALVILTTIGMASAWTCGKLFSMVCNV